MSLIMSWLKMFSIDIFKYKSTFEAHKGVFINKRSSFSKRMKLYFDIFHSENIKYNFHRNFSKLSKKHKIKCKVLCLFLTKWFDVKFIQFDYEISIKKQYLSFVTTY